MTHDRAKSRREDLINELLDGSMDREWAREAYESLRGDAAACEDLARLRYAVARLSAPVPAPDLSGEILHQVDLRRRFLSRGRRRLITAGRLGVAAGVVVAVGLASFVQRNVPELRVAEAETPVTRVVESTQHAARGQTQLMETAVESIQSSLASPVARLSLSPTYRPADGLSFDLEISAPSAERVAAARALPPGSASSLATAPAIASLGPLNTPLAIRPAQSATAGPAHPFIDRFGPLLVILRDPTPALVDENPPADER